MESKIPTIYLHKLCTTVQAVQFCWQLKALLGRIGQQTAHAHSKTVTNIITNMITHTPHLAFVLSYCFHFSWYYFFSSFSCKFYEKFSIIHNFHRIPTNTAAHKVMITKATIHILIQTHWHSFEWRQWQQQQNAKYYTKSSDLRNTNFSYFIYSYLLWIGWVGTSCHAFLRCRLANRTPSHYTRPLPPKVFWL